MLKSRALTIGLGAVLSLASCSNSAYQHFDFSKENERAASNLQVARIVDNNLTQAYIGMVYLNKTDKENYFDQEYFLLSFYYPKEGNNSDFNITLNGQEAQYSEKLTHEDNLSKLFPLQMKWNHYYYLMFPTQTTSALKLSFENSHSQKAVITYQKEYE